MTAPSNLTQAVDTATFSGTVSGSTGTTVTFGLTLGSANPILKSVSTAQSCVNTNCTTTFSVSFGWTAGSIALGNQTATLVVTDSQSRTVSVDRTLSIVAGTPVASLSNATLSFAAQSQGTASAAQSVTLTNTGNSILNIASITASGDFTRTTDCGASLAATASCTISVTFTPAGVGNRTGAISVASDAAGSPTTLNLSGSGVAVPTVTLSIVPNWNLVGNSVNATLDVAGTFGDAGKVSTVWKWIAASSKWAFYTPTIPDGGAAYAATKGYDVLTTINAGEGFWVNAKATLTASLPSGAALTAISFQDQVNPTQNRLLSAWNLIATGDNVTPSVFNHGLSLTPPAPGVVPLNVTSLWAWDSSIGNWYFYAPSLEANGGLLNYITSKNYLDFATRALDPTMGFWVNKP